MLPLPIVVHEKPTIEGCGIPRQTPSTPRGKTAAKVGAAVLLAVYGLAVLGTRVHPRHIGCVNSGDSTSPDAIDVRVHRILSGTPLIGSYP